MTDFTKWTVDGYGEGELVVLAQTDTETFFEFLREIAEGNSVSLHNMDMRHLASFSLRGSYAAIMKLAECFDRLPASSSDPFKSSRDPF